MSHHDAVEQEMPTVSPTLRQNLIIYNHLKNPSHILPALSLLSSLCSPAHIHLLFMMPSRKLDKQFVALSRGAQNFQSLCHHHLHLSDVPGLDRTYGEAAHTKDADFPVAP